MRRRASQSGQAAACCILMSLAATAAAHSSVASFWLRGGPGEGSHPAIESLCAWLFRCGSASDVAFHGRAIAFLPVSNVILASARPRDISDHQFDLCLI